MTDFKDIFISYGRPDSKAFAIRLKARLVQEGFNVWLDLNDIPLGVDFQKYIDSSLDQAHNFLFVISPHAVNSPYCALELERALQFNKRIIPLLHVEEIHYQTWQERNPHGTDEDWKHYRAEGKHSSFAHMHPVIRKLNWAPFQAEQIQAEPNQFEQSIQDLVQQLQTDVDYIHRHTEILNQALRWVQHQHRTRYLLTGKACQAASSWLTQKKEFVSCQPSELHGDFIAQSIKNSHNLMCQIFLCYAEEDLDNATRIRRSLTQQAFTVWTSRTDILTGEDFEAAIRRGIEQADNLIYLISPEAMQSRYCQDELTYALSLNKRIIPILARPTHPAQIPLAIRSIQYIDLTDNVSEEDYRLDESQLLQVLRQDASYHEEHKNLLVKAIKWQRQEDNPSILLKNHSLSHYETWLKLAQERPLYGPIELQKSFVATSSQQPPDATVDVFIIYDPADLDFARKLNETLQIHGQSTWFAQESLLPESNYSSEVTTGIVTSENIVLILSSDAAASDPCAKDLSYAQASNKRILVVLYRESQEAVSIQETISKLKDCPTIDFQENDEDFLTNFGKLYRVLESNPQHVHEHTRLLIRAKEWEQEQEDDCFLLRGRNLKTAETWLKEATHNKPQPTDLQHRYIQASRELPLRRVHPVSVASWGAVTTLIVALARILGLFQPAEFLAYDHLLRRRPDERPDDRFTLIKLDRLSGAYLRQKQIDGVYPPSIGSIPDQALLQLLTTLDAHQPRLIGLDFYRDFPASVLPLQQKLRTMENLVGICKARAVEAEAPGQEGGIADPDLGGYAPIYEVRPADYGQRIGFNDFLNDHRSFMLRRQYLWKAPDPETCDVPEAMSLTLARRYLEREGLVFTPPQLSEASPESGRVTIQPNSLTLGPVTVPQLRAGGHAGGLYGEPKRLAGYQTLLNFRRVNGKAEEFAASVSLEDLLEGRFSPELIRDRIVLIGITDLSDRNVDFWNTPVGEVAGVILHGQMASQLISAALDQRRLIWWLPLQGEMLWLLGWSFVGGFVAWGFYRPLPLVLAAGGGLLLIYGAGVIVMGSFAGLLPTVPAIATLLLTGGITLYRNHRLRKV